MAKLANLARMTVSGSPGTGDITLLAAVSGFKTFAQAGITNGQGVWYGIKDGSNSEQGFATYSSTGPQLTGRTVYASTNSDSFINASSSAEVFITPSAASLLRIEEPGGRLTLTTATPILTSTTSAQTTVYYTPYKHRFVPLYDGTSFEMHDIGGELSQATTDATKSPAACTTNSNYDLFVWNDAGTYRCTRGPLWSSDTSRGTGAGTTELERVQGIYLNKVAITNGPAANRGTYVGTIRTNGSSQVDWIFGAAASGGTAGVFGVWNMYHRRMFGAMVHDTTNFWDVAPSGPRAANGSNTMRVSVITGLREDNVIATYTALSNGLGAAIPLCAIGVNSTSVMSSTSGYGLLSNLSSFMASYTGSAIGWNYYQALENASTAATVRFYGQAGDSTRYNAGLVVEFFA